MARNIYSAQAENYKTCFSIIPILGSLLIFASNWLFLKDGFCSEAAQPYVSTVICLYSTFLLISTLTYLNKFSFIIVHLILLLIASLFSYFKFYYGIVISSSLIDSIINTDAKEVVELWNISLFSWVFATGIVPSILLIYLTIKGKRPKIISYVAYCVLAFVLAYLSLVIAPKDSYRLVFLRNSLVSFMPYSYLLGLKNYYDLYRSHSVEIKAINDIFSFKRFDHSDLTAVLVIGESARSDRFSLNGYARNTNPNLSKVTNLLSFKQSYSLATNTVAGVENIMRRSGHFEASSFIKVFRDLGFKTYWLSNQNSSYKKINSIANEAENKTFSDDLRTSKFGNNYDEDLLPIIEKIPTAGQRNLIIVHTIGSHRLYDLRYPPEFRTYSPTCITDEVYYSTHECTDKEKLNNSYDNSILYTDYFLNHLIKILEESRAMMIYISDHGESLGENDIYAHCYPLEMAPKEQVHVPMLFWASTKFLSEDLNRQKFKNAQKKLDLKLDQSNIFHSILDCSNITSSNEGIILDKSLCND